MRLREVDDTAWDRTQGQTKIGPRYAGEVAINFSFFLFPLLPKVIIGMIMSFPSTS